jgi:Flp pilus assembly protein TadD
MTHGRKALVRGDVREAQRAYCRAVRADPGNASAQAELARLLLIRRDAKAGLAQVRRALEIEPHSRVLQGLLGDALARLGQYDAARTAWLTEAQLDGAGDDSDEALAKIFLGTARQHRFRHAWGEAERFYRRVAVLEPSNVEASLGLAQALRGLKEPGEARAWAAYAAQLQSAPLEGAAIARDQGVGP